MDLFSYSKLLHCRSVTTFIMESMQQKSLPRHNHHDDDRILQIALCTCMTNKSIIANNPLVVIMQIVLQIAKSFADIIGWGVFLGVSSEWQIDSILFINADYYFILPQATELLPYQVVLVVLIRTHQEFPRFPFLCIDYQSRFTTVWNNFTGQGDNFHTLLFSSFNVNQQRIEYRQIINSTRASAV